MADLIKNTVFTVTINGCSSSGDGVARIDGKVVFVKGAIEGETCEVKILKSTKNISYAKIEKIIVPSPHRVDPPCPNFQKCGGCNFMHVDYSEELRIKQQRVNEALARIGGLDLKVSGIVGSDLEYRYRNKAIYAVSRENGKTVAGFYRARSHSVIPIEQCLIQSEVFDRAVLAVTSWMDAYHISAYDESKCEGTVRHIFCRYAGSTDKVQITIVVGDNNIPHTDELISGILKACPETSGIIINLNEKHDNTVLRGTFRTIWGSDFLEDTLCSLRFNLSPQSFYQINRLQAEKLYNKAIEYAGLKDTETVLDLYCGTGTITLCLSGHAKLAIGAEIAQAAITDAYSNAQQNNIENVQFICADAYDAAEQLKNSGIFPEVVVVDPPRKGLSPAVIQVIADLSPDRVVYISCDPATLARDLKLFSESGYLTQEATAFDMFPKCAHVETVALLSKLKLTTAIEV